MPPEHISFTTCAQKKCIADLILMDGLFHLSAHVLLCTGYYIFAKMTRSWTNTEVHMLLTEVQAQFTVQMGQLSLFWQQAQSWWRASSVHSRQWTCSTAKVHRVPRGSCMPTCIREPTQSPKGASVSVLVMKESMESGWTEEQSWKEGLTLWKYAG